HRSRTGTRHLHGSRPWRRALALTSERPSSFLRVRSSFEHRLEDITRKPRIFSKPPDGISVPVPAKRNIQAYVMTARMDDVAQLFLNSQEHLKFICCRWELQFANNSHCFPNH